MHLSMFSFSYFMFSFRSFFKYLFPPLRVTCASPIFLLMGQGRETIRIVSISFLFYSHFKTVQHAHLNAGRVTDCSLDCQLPVDIL